MWDKGRPDRAEEDAQSEMSEGEIREREKKAEAQRLEAGGLQQERDLVRNEGSCTIYMLGTDRGGVTTSRLWVGQWTGAGLYVSP